ncbi:MAG: thioredoxin family [Acidobacteriaceae bacterium]|nr:thioredoxin family [Acidobacteriaceae bacterium]
MTLPSITTLLRTALLALVVAPAANLVAQGPTPIGKKHIYLTEANAKADIAAAIAKARKEHKRIILDFGGDWCGDCQVLDIYFRQSPNADLLAKHFVLVHVDIGRYDNNTDVAKKYKIPLEKGVPALAVLNSSGTLLYSQENKEFEHMASMTPQSVTEFLNRWKF